MSGRFVRASKFRHVHGTPSKDVWTGVARAYTNGDGNLLAVNDKFVAYSQSAGGGPVVVLDRSKPARLGAKVPSMNLHKGKVGDIAFSPFMPNVIATGSEDCTVRVTLLPEEGLTGDVYESDQSTQFAGHQKKIGTVLFHPTCFILASTSYDNTVKIWDLTAGAEAAEWSCGAGVHAAAWNKDGSVLAACGKDKMIHLVDPRAQGSASATQGFEGAKAAKPFWVDNLNYVGACGFSKRAQRQYMVWDARNMDKPLYTDTLDQGGGVMIVHFDQDTNMLYVTGKGDGYIKYYEIDQEGVHSLSQYRDSMSHRGCAFLPKRSVSVQDTEVANCYRLLSDSIVPVSFRVPRKSEMFQADLYPDTYAGNIMLTPEEWLGGKNEDPASVSMKPGEGGADGGAGGAGGGSGGFEMPKSRAQLVEELAAANKRIEELEAELAKHK